MAIWRTLLANMKISSAAANEITPVLAIAVGIARMARPHAAADRKRRFLVVAWRAK